MDSITQEAQMVRQALLEHGLETPMFDNGLSVPFLQDVNNVLWNTKFQQHLKK